VGKVAGDDTRRSCQAIFGFFARVPHQDPIDVRVKNGMRCLGPELVQLILGTSGTQVHPMIEHVELGAALRDRHASGKRPRLQFQRGQSHPQAYVVQYERLLADAGALAPTDLVTDARGPTIGSLETQDLQAQRMARAMSVSALWPSFCDWNTP